MITALPFFAVISNDGWTLSGTAIRSNPIGHSQSTSITLRASHTTTATVRVSSEANFDWLTVTDHTGQQVARISGTQTASFAAISGGQYRFVYKKDGGASFGDDAAFIEDFPLSRVAVEDYRQITSAELEFAGLISVAGGSVSLQEGVGIIATGEVYAPANRLLPNQFGAMLDAGDQLALTLELRDGQVWAGGAALVAASVCYPTEVSGQLLLLGEDGLPLWRSEAFGFADHYFALRVPQDSYLAEVGTAREIDIVGSFITHLQRQQQVFANRESRAQAFPNPQGVRLNQSSHALRVWRGHHNPLDASGNQRQQGFIANQVTINNIPAPNRRVLCYDQAGNLMDETKSDAGGHYRFDNLPLNQRYMLVAQDHPAHDYNATAADYQNATPYGATA